MQKATQRSSPRICAKRINRDRVSGDVDAVTKPTTLSVPPLMMHIRDASRTWAGRAQRSLLGIGHPSVAHIHPVGIAMRGIPLGCSEPAHAPRGSPGGGSTPVRVTWSAQSGIDELRARLCHERLGDVLWQRRQVCGKQVALSSAC